MGRSRTGTSVLTSIVQAHGAELGETQPENQWGYRSHENVAMRNYLKKQYPGSPDGPIIETKRDDDGIREKLDKLFPEGRFAYKCGVRFFPVFDGLYDDAKFILTIRDLRSVCGSLLQKNPNDLGFIAERSAAYFAYIMDLADERGYPIVNMDAVMAGDRQSLADAIAYCGFDYDDDIAVSLIDPSKWNTWQDDPRIVAQLDALFSEG